jgi:inosine-uridine nucleoside N-ribohydrolase
MEQKKEKWIIDCDPGVDDMMAMLYLISRPNVEVVMISLVDGNVALDYVSINSRKIVKISGKTIPLYRGSSHPIIRSTESASYHYEDGLGDIEDIKHFSIDDINIEKENSALKLVETICKYPGEINLLCIGPLTTIATALLIKPDLPDLIKSVYIMGGACTSRGNRSPTGEFNFVYDYIAAKMVIPKLKNAIITPWETCEPILFNDKYIEPIIEKFKHLEKHNKIMLHFVKLMILKYTQERSGARFCDLYGIIPAFQPSAVKKFSMCKLDIIVDTEDCKGCTYVIKRKEICENYEEFVKTKLCTFNEEGYHLVIEELDREIVNIEYESSFY